MENISQLAYFLSPRSFGNDSASRSMSYGTYSLVSGVFNTVFYSFVVIVIIRYWTDFANPFYRCVLALGICDIFIILYIDLYGGISQILGQDPLGETFAAIGGAIQMILWYNTHPFHLLLAIQRFTAIVWFS